MKNINLLKKLWNKLTYRFRTPKVCVTRAQLSGNDSFVDIRYRVIRPNKIKGIALIYLIDEATGEKLNLMKIPRYGSVKTKHSSNQEEGVLLFRNLNKTVNNKSKLTLVYDKYKVEHIEMM